MPLEPLFGPSENLFGPSENLFGFWGCAAGGWSLPPLGGPLAQAETAAAGELQRLGGTPLIILAVYLLVLLALGIYGWLRSKAGEEDYYLAGRGQGWVVSSLTIMATFFSSFALLGAPGMVYREGVVFALFSLNVPVAGLCVYLLGSRIWKLGRRFGYVTPGDMIAQYYGSRYSLRLLVAISGFLYAIPYVVMQIQSGGIVSEKLFHGASLQIGPWELSSFTVGSTVLAAITMLYIMIGGMRSVAWTDLIQGLLLISGMLVSGFAMILVFGGVSEFGQRVTTELPAASLTSPGNSGTWFWPMVLSVCLFSSTGSMVQPAQWMRYYSARNVATLRRGALIFAIVLTSCFMLGVMLIGLAGQVLYPLQFEYQASWTSQSPATTVSIPDALQGHLRVEWDPPQAAPANGQTADSVGQGQEHPGSGRLVWAWQGGSRAELRPEDVAELLARNPDPAVQQAVQRLHDLQRTTRPQVSPSAELGGDFNSILVVMLNDQIPRVLGTFGAVFASLLLVAIMAASMSTADSNLHALSAVLTRDVYDQYIRPQASEGERVWIGRLVIVAATIFSLALVLAGSEPSFRARYDFLGMIAMMGLMAIAFSAQLLPVTVDILFLRRGTGKGAAAGLAAGLLATFLFGPLFALLVEGLGSPPLLAEALELVNRLKFTPLHGSIWGLLVNVPVFVLVSLFTRPVPPERRQQFAETLQEVAS